MITVHYVQMMNISNCRTDLVGNTIFNGSSRRAVRTQEHRPRKMARALINLILRPAQRSAWYMISGCATARSLIVRRIQGVGLRTSGSVWEFLHDGVVPTRQGNGLRLVRISNTKIVWTRRRLPPTCLGE